VLLVSPTAVDDKKSPAKENQILLTFSAIFREQIALRRPADTGWHG
jgi:hypothetical protein